MTATDIVTALTAAQSASCPAHKTPLGRLYLLGESHDANSPIIVVAV